MMAFSDDALFWMEILSSAGAGSCRWLELSRRLTPRRTVAMLRSGPGRGELSRLLGKKISPPDMSMVERERSFASADRCGALSINDASYPDLLREIPQAPPLIFFMGDPSVLGRPAICIVGSRKPSRRGAIAAFSMAEGLGRRGVLVVSGLARGVDASAHHGALGTPGSTCAVLGCGLDVPYPPDNLELAVDIASHGCLVSEFPPGAPPLRYHFPMRNRILSGLARAVVVVEAGIGSGAIGTATWAAEQGRDVFAVPGPVDWRGSRGPHKLIKEGAGLVEGWEDIFASVPALSKGGAGGGPVQGGAIDPAAPLPEGITESEKIVYKSLGIEPKHVDELVQICHISTIALLPALLGLELKGLAEDCGAGRYALAAGKTGMPERE